jgi:lipopolysaccharide transport system permease protein
VADAGFVRKIYFPRIFMPVAPTMAGLVDLAVAMLILVAMMGATQRTPGLAIITFPYWVLMLVVMAAGAGAWFSALSVRYRDVLYMIPFILQLGFFVTPIMFTPQILPAPWSSLYAINPMASFIEGFRWSVTGSAHAPGPALIPATMFAVVFLVSGVLYFRRTERIFADLI